jgi:AraC family transcriptional regulator of arabinose operon
VELHNTLNFLFQNANMNILEFDIHIRQELQILRRSEPFYIMSYHKSGEANLRIGDKVYCISPGTAILIPPYVKHDHFKDSKEETTFFWCHFNYDIGNVVDILKIFNIPITFKIKNVKDFEKAFLEYKDLMTSSNFLSSTVLKKAKAYEILYLFLESALNYNQENIKKNKHAEGFLCMLCEIIQHPEQDLSLSNLSAKYHLHPTYISNRFKELFGLSPVQIQKELRVSRAKTLLKTSEMSIASIAESVGFNGVSNFTRLFKSYVGISPTKFRNLNERWSNERDLKKGGEV